LWGVGVVFLNCGSSWRAETSIPFALYCVVCDIFCWLFFFIYCLSPGTCERDIGVNLAGLDK
jgi:hypothetical protein